MASEKNLPLGLACALGVICIWSTFIVSSRAGVTSSLTPYDLTGLRFAVAGLVAAPFTVAWWPRHVSWKGAVVLAACGPGGIYGVLMFNGLEQASAAYGGVFANGSLPLFSMAIAYLALRDIPTARQALAVALIVLGGALLAYRGMTAVGADVAVGILLFLAASAILSVYMFGVRHWSVTPRQALALITLPNAAVFVPLWLFAFPSGMAETDQLSIVAHALFQGLGPGFLAVILFALALIHLGPTPTAAFSAVVPATAALLAIPVLGEHPTTLEWVGIVVVSVGLAVLVTGARKG